MQIGNVDIKTPIFLAPMAGITDYSFRILCKEQGAGLVYSEFVSAHGIIRENQRTLELIAFSKAERPIGIQIFGDEPDVMAKAARYVAHKYKPDILDINYGCPVPKVTKKGAGSAALRDLNLMDEITSAVVTAIPKVAVTVKMRAGWNSSSIIIPEAGRRQEKMGVKAITLHPRTTKQNYSVKADWTMIKELKDSVSVPVIGNGDVSTPDDMMRMFAETGCDAVMVGRAALGNPWFFQDAQARLENKPLYPAPTISDRIKMCRRHFELLLENRGERTGINLMRKHFGWYIKGFTGASKFRKRLITASGLEEIRLELTRLLKQVN